tara:strand:- start:57 stop:227 length:171 start_codon:yes stop_codon:yes gene_type:complete
MTKRNITTPDNIKYGDLPAEVRMKIKKMQEEAKKKDKKNESIIEKMSRILYGGSSK